MPGIEIRAWQPSASKFPTAAELGDINRLIGRGGRRARRDTKEELAAIDKFIAEAHFNGYAQFCESERYAPRALRRRARAERRRELTQLVSEWARITLVLLDRAVGANPTVKTHRPPQAMSIAQEILACIGRQPKEHHFDLRKLYAHFQRLNDKHFEGRLALPAIVLKAMDSYGQCYYNRRPVEININRCMSGKRIDDMRLGAQGVLLHEMIHQSQAQSGVARTATDRRTGGHGEYFWATANRIGRQLGLVEISRDEADTWPLFVETVEKARAEAAGATERKRLSAELRRLMADTPFLKPAHAVAACGFVRPRAAACAAGGFCCMGAER